MQGALFMTSRAEAVGGRLIDSNDETVELRYFNIDEIPPLFCKQHRDILNDIVAGRDNVYK